MRNKGDTFDCDGNRDCFDIGTACSPLFLFGVDIAEEKYIWIGDDT